MLEFSDIHKSFKTQKVLEGITSMIQPGELLGSWMQVGRGNQLSRASSLDLKPQIKDSLRLTDRRYWLLTQIS